MDDEKNLDTNVEDKVNDTVEDKVDSVEIKTYTQDDIDALQSQIDELLQYKPNELSDTEKALQDKADNLWKKEVALSLKESNLEDFAEFINVPNEDVDALNQVIKRFREILGKRELSDAYKPSDHRGADKYSVAEKHRDVKGMIGSKISNIFK